jgi:hypothetical protein
MTAVMIIGGPVTFRARRMDSCIDIDGSPKEHVSMIFQGVPIVNSATGEIA